MAENPRIDVLRRRVQLDPASVAFAELAEAYRRDGRIDEAIDTCRTGLIRHPSYAAARVTLGRALVDRGLLDEAAAELERVLLTAPENLAAVRTLAEIHARREPPSAAPPVAVTVLESTMPPEPEPEPGEVRALETFLEAIQTARRPGHGPTA
jgi:Flp pilus assembly protein TadD